MQSLGFSLTEIRQVLEGLRARDIDCADGAHLLNDKRSSRRTNQRSERSQANSAAGAEALSTAAVVRDLRGWACLRW
jgi:DNA-binding transcriptional MerR regulator